MNDRTSNFLRIKSNQFKLEYLTLGDDYTFVDQLPALGVNPNSVTGTGYCNLGFFIHQLHIAYPDIIKGVAVITAGVYRSIELCSSNGEDASFGNCTYDDPDKLAQASLDLIYKDFA